MLLPRRPRPRPAIPLLFLETCRFTHNVQLKNHARQVLSAKAATNSCNRLPAYPATVCTNVRISCNRQFGTKSKLNYPGGAAMLEMGGRGGAATGASLVDGGGSAVRKGP